jgi:pimeloyl-ACP methyl ester carboxylesterase
VRRVLLVLLVSVAICSLLSFAGCGSPGETRSAGPAAARPAISKVPVDDMEMAYRVYGKGYPLVMIMGFSGTQDVWDPNVISELAGTYRVITFDNRGMGGTTPGTKPFTIEQFSDDTAGLMEALGIAQAHVLGFSMGSEIA